MLQLSIVATERDSLKGGCKNSVNLVLVRNAVIVFVLTATVLQLLLSFTLANILLSVLLSLGLVAGLVYALDRDKLSLYPISTLMILGYVLSLCAIPPLGKLSEIQPITEGLRHPVLVGFYIVIGLLSLLLGHVLYRRFSLLLDLRSVIMVHFYEPLKMFVVPRDIESWLLGAVGVAAVILSAHRSMLGGNIAAAVIQGLRPLMYIPYIIASPRLVYPRLEVKSNFRWPPLVMYTVVVVVASMVVNSRGVLFKGVASVFIVYIYRLLEGSFRPPKIRLATVVIIVCGIVLVSGPVTNIAASMVLVRKYRKESSSLSLVKETWNMYRSGAAVRLYRREGNRTRETGGYDEGYYSNLLLNRFGNIKFIDLGVGLERDARTLGTLNYFRKYEYQKCFAIIPLPLIHLLGMHVNKRKALSGSSQDFLYTAATGNPLGGFKTGSPIFLTGALFGAIWPAILSIVSAIIFSLSDALCMPQRVCKRGIVRDVVFLSPIAMVTLFMYTFMFTNTEAQGFPSLVAEIMRGWIQVGVVYGMVFAFVRSVGIIAFPRGDTEAY